MNTRTSGITVSILIASSFLMGLVIYPQLPALVASHWNASGNVDGYMTKFWGIFFMPLIMAVMSLLIYFLPRIDPYIKNVESFRKYYNIFLVIFNAFLFYIYLLTISWNLGYRFNFNLFIIPAMSALFYFIGILLERSKRNWFIGIRTPWTLSSDEVWNKTHKLGGKLFKASALISLFGLILPVKFSLLAVLLPVIFSSVYVSIYSYFTYRESVLSK